MADLTLMATTLIAEPLAPRPTIDQLRRRNTRRRHRRMAGAGGAGLAIGLVVALVAVLAAPGGGPATTPSVSLASYVVAATQVPDSVLAEVGLPPSVTPPIALTGQPPLTDQGRPAVVYVGGEFCPYCAVQRWALVIALSRFGTFADLGRVISSSSTDVYPDLQSWSFHGSSYSSPYLTFDPAEVYSDTASSGAGPTGGYTSLDALSPLQSQAFETYDAPPYTGGSSGSIPFVDIGNRYLAVGASASPAPLEGLSLDQIGARLADPASPVARTVDGTANYLTAALCAVTGLHHPPICSSPMVAQAEQEMAGG